MCFLRQGCWEGRPGDKWTLISICMPPAYKQRRICVSYPTAALGTPLSPETSQGLSGEEEGGTKQGSSLTASETVVSFLPDLPNCRWPCSVSGCGPGELQESTRSSARIQGIKVKIPREIPHLQEGAAHSAPACPNLRGSHFVRANMSLINHLASWSFSSLASSVRHQTAFGKSNPALC